MKTVVFVLLGLVVLMTCAAHAEEAKKAEYTVAVDTTKINLAQQVDQLADVMKKHLDGPMGMYYQACKVRHRILGVSLCMFGWPVFLCGTAFISAAIRVNRKGDTAECYWLGGVLCIGIGIVLVLNGTVQAISADCYAMNDILNKIGAIAH